MDNNHGKIRPFRAERLSLKYKNVNILKLENFIIFKSVTEHHSYLQTYKKLY